MLFTPRLKLSTQQVPPGRNGACSVLVVIAWNKETEVEEIVLTKRTQHVETHKGQVSFPGGFWEPSDESLLATALRETDEEIGIPSNHVELLGALPSVFTRGNIPIYPWVVKSELPYPFRISEGEVDKVIYLPVSRLLEEGLRPVTIDLEGRKIESIGIVVDEEMVWGATARILELLRQQFLTP